MNDYQRGYHDGFEKGKKEEPLSDHALLGEVRAYLERSRIPHNYCEDSWYSCPKAEDGCANDYLAADECNCGADEYNNDLDEILHKIASISV